MKRFTISRQTGVILVVCMLVLFLSGLGVMQSLQRAHLKLLYGRTQQLIKQALRETEDRIAAAKQTAYDIIVSDATQTSVSGYWDAYDAGAGRVALINWTDGITNSVATYINGNDDVLCADFIDADGAVKVVASRKHIKLNPEQAAFLSAEAVKEDGGTLLMSGEGLGLGKDTLLVLKQLREKRRLSMRHTGVVILFLDIRELGSSLTDSWEGTFLLENGDMAFELGSELRNGFEADDALNGYSLREYGGVQYFVLGISGKIFEKCMAVLPYSPIFDTSRQLFLKHTLIYALICALIFAGALTLTRFMTADFARFRRHLHGISAGNTDVIPTYAAQGRSRDADELFQSFNSMAEQINRLVHDNYEAQLAVKDAQLSALQAQINPHFLYNTLNSIYWAAKSGENEEAAAMTQDLSQLLRDAVNTDENVVSVDRELEIACNYIRIQKHRYRERLNVEFDIESEVSDLAVPKFTIQPLLENAIKYGVEPSISGGTVYVHVSREGEKCVCKVMNEGSAPEADLSRRIREGNIVGHGTGIGLVNIDRRIRAMFGGECGVSVYRDEESKRTVTKVEFTAIPFEKMQEAQQ
ncbi:MAG: sensor histidine kinase [Clostridia bacterium]|nr:sensor histidine kinase [Clostridia bacterium]